ncbi:ribosomal protein S27AE [Parabacteroides sp. PFB2-12]|uniref:hypothetical protein n=1 Tax=unclassified Parabacteroides TaxID=2649774 RepID=UPI00247475F1|nr:MULTISPECIES: hypothetical protein [unclassified Parabacteroides]MDH6343434.1 ribosomal protein S27AE [Parabacteroides sp. PM6-13]MDH6391974.1 ribosomal protein S27AE [Parabacteroides sp. PFB2-12]
METTQFIEITNQACPNCGAQVSISNENQSFVCDFCQTEVRLVRPVVIKTKNEVIEALSENEQKRYSNLITIIESAMIAENYDEAYEYCNKALEIVPNSAALWENKAICSFWNSTKGDIVNKQAKETVTYLRSAKRYAVDNDTVYITSENIAWNLYYLSRKWASKLYSDKDGYSWGDAYKIFDYISLYEICYEIHDDVFFLKSAIDEFVLQKTYNIGWLDNDNVKKVFPNIQSLVDRYEKMIQTKEPEYVKPAVPSSDSMPWWFMLILISLVLFVIFIILSE